MEPLGRLPYLHQANNEHSGKALHFLSFSFIFFSFSFHFLSIFFHCFSFSHFLFILFSSFHFLFIFFSFFSFSCSFHFLRSFSFFSFYTDFFETFSFQGKFFSCSFHFLFIFFSFSFHFLFIFFSFSFHFLFIFFSFSFIFFSFSFHFLFIFFSFSFYFLFIFFSFSFIFFHCFSVIFFPFFFLVLFFSGAQNPLFFPRLPHDFLLKLLCKKSMFGAVSGGYTIGPSFCFSCQFFHFFIFVFFSISFHVFSIFFSFFQFLFLFFFFSQKKFFLFHVVSLFSCFGCSKSVAALQDSLVQSAHSELALFALYWLVVTFPCGMVHILVMIRLRVVHGGRRVGQVLPSNQNHQIGAFDETADAPQSSLFSLLSSLFFSLLLSSSLFFSLHLSSINIGLFFSRFRSLAGLSQVPRGWLAGRSRVAPFFLLWTDAHSEKVCSSPRENVEPLGRLS